MRRKPKAQNSRLKITEPMATAPISDGSGIWPTTPVSTMPISGVETFDSITGIAMRRTCWCVSCGVSEGRSLVERLGMRREIQDNSGRQC